MREGGSGHGNATALSTQRHPLWTAAARNLPRHPHHGDGRLQVLAVWARPNFELATSEPFDWLGAFLLGLTGLVLLGGALGLTAYHYRRCRGGRQDVVMEPNSPPTETTDYDTSSNSESAEEESEPQNSQPPPRPQLPNAQPLEPIVVFNSKF